MSFPCSCHFYTSVTHSTTLFFTYISISEPERAVVPPQMSQPPCDFLSAPKGLQYT